MFSMQTFYSLFNSLLDLVLSFYKKNICLILISLVGFIDVMGVGLVYPMFASMIYQGDCHLLPADASETLKGTCLGILLATMPVTQLFSAPILGMLSDQKGRRKVLLPALAVGFLAYLVGVVAASNESFLLLLLSRVGIGISAGSAAVVGAALVDISSQEEKAKNFGIFNMACGLGFTAGPFLGGALTGTPLGNMGGYSLPFALAGGVTLVNLVMIYFLFEETYIPQKKGPLNFLLGFKNLQKAFLGSGLRPVFFSIFLACLGWSFYWEFTPVTWIKIHHFDTATIGIFYAYGSAVYALSCGFFIPPIVNRFSKQNVLCFALFLCSISMGMLLINTSQEWLWFYIPLQQFAIALFWPTASTVVSNSVSEKEQGEILGVLQSVDSMAFAVSPLIAGPLLSLSSSMPIIIGGSATFLAGLVLVFFLKNIKNFSPSPA